MKGRSEGMGNRAGALGRRFTPDDNCSDFRYLVIFCTAKF